MNMLFRFTFQSPVSAPDCLYFRGGAFVRDHVEVEAGDRCSFDTIFNCFSLDRYRSLCGLEKVTVRLLLQGEGTVSLHWTPLEEDIRKAFAKVDAYQDGFARVQTPYPDVTLRPQTVSEVPFACVAPQWVECEVPFALCEGQGMLYPVVEARGTCSLWEGGYYTSAEPLRHPTVALVICTYRREEYVRANMARLAAFWRENPQWQAPFGVYVVDNGNTLGAIEGVQVIPNRNLGGSGGFTRGLMQAHEDGYTHALLMDDDIAFDPWVLVKTYTLLQYATCPTLSVGGSMMQQDKPTLQFEMGARWHHDRLFACRRGYDVSLPVDVLRNEQTKVPDYNAWWFMCMPTLYVERYGLPLPLFIKGDDIEYGLRCCHRQIATMNGIGVWHECFAYKYSGELTYYSRRNELIVSAMHAPLRTRYAVHKLVRGMAKELIFQHYDEAELMLTAYRDFLKGPQFLAHVDGESLHKALRKPFAQYSKAQLVEQGYWMDRDYTVPPSAPKWLKALNLNGYLLPPCCFDPEDRQKGRLVHLAEATPKDMYKAPWSIQYNEETDRGFVTHLNRRRMWRLMLSLVPMSVRFLLRYKKVCRAYREALPVLGGIEGWQERLGLAPDEE